MQLVLSWPIRLFVVAVLIISLFVDGAGYVYRIVNKLPLQGNVAGLPPNFGGLQLYFHKGLDLAGGTHIDYQLTNFPAGQSRADVQKRTIDVINKRVNSLGVSEPEIRGAGSRSPKRSWIRRRRTASARWRWRWRVRPASPIESIQFILMNYHATF